jgi:hypothetical protein
MKYQIRLKATLSLLAFILIAAFPSASQADPLVLGGFDLFQTVPPAKFNLGQDSIAVKGVPLGTFNFGSGPVNTFNADTVVRRLGDATPANPTINLQVVALQFMSVDPVNFGTGTDFLFVTLQSARGGPASLGLLTINFGPEGSPHGTFDSTLSVFFDVRVGSLNGDIIFSGMKTLTALGVPWSHFPPPDAVLIPGVNFMLNGQNQLNDFFPIGSVMHQNPDGSMHTVETATVPEPTTLGLLAAGIAGVAARIYRRRKSGESVERDS